MEQVLFLEFGDGWRRGCGVVGCDRLKRVKNGVGCGRVEGHCFVHNIIADTPNKIVKFHFHSSIKLIWIDKFVSPIQIGQSVLDLRIHQFI